MSATRVDAIVTKLRAYVGAGPHHGILLEDVKKLPRGVNVTGFESIGSWLSRSRRSPRTPPAWLPADYRHFVARWGSLTWLAPEGVPDDVWCYLGNTGDKALIDLNERFDLREATEAAGLDGDLALERIVVFHDGYNDGFAFDARVRRGPRGEVLVVPFVEDELAKFLGKKRPKPVGTFVEWLEARIARSMAAIGPAPQPARAVTTKVPASIEVPKHRGINLRNPVDVGPGWRHLETQAYAKAATLARSALQRDPVFLYAHAMLLDALGGLARTHKTPAPLHAERCTVAWTLLALARRGVENIHADYHRMFQQKALTVLAELAMESSLVSIVLAKKLIAEASRLRIDPSAIVNAGTWDTRGVKARLDKI